jgi:hypothetical protein
MKTLVNFQVEGEFTPAPTKTDRFTPHFEVIVALGKDATGYFTTDEDGLKWLDDNGFIAPFILPQKFVNLDSTK